MDTDQDFLITIHLRGYGKQGKVEAEYRETLNRVLKLEFGDQVQAAQIVHVSEIDLRKMSNGTHPRTVCE